MGVVTTTLMVMATLASTGLAAYGQYQAGQQAKAAGEYNAAVARNNATQAEAWANYNAEQERKKRIAARASMVSAYAKSGVVLDENGTPGYVLNEQLVQDELSIQTILRQGEAQAGSLRSQASMYEIEGSNAAKAGTLAAISTGIKGITSAASMAGVGQASTTGKGLAGSDMTFKSSSGQFTSVPYTAGKV